MSGQHSKLILKLNKALGLLSQKVYTDVLTEKDPTQDYSLFDLLSQCRNELTKIDDRDLIKIANLVEKESK
jgi:hypothetical protein